MTKLSLINYEGDCLHAKKENGKILVIDQWGKTVETLTTKDLLEFVFGAIDIEDSRGKSWNFQKESSDATPSLQKVYEFITYNEKAMSTRELTWEEQVQWVMKNTDVELENVYIVEEIAKPTTPTHIAVFELDGVKLSVYQWKA
jgi:hypothetical protein